MLTGKNNADAKLTMREFLIMSSKLFTASFSAALASAGTLILTILTPAANKGKAIHCRFIIDVDKVGAVLITEGDTVTGGSAVTAYNLNRNSGEAATCTIVHDGTINPAGTSIKAFFAVPGHNEFEMILKPSIKYSITFTSATTTTTAIGTLEFWEE